MLTEFMDADLLRRWSNCLLFFGQIFAVFLPPLFGGQNVRKIQHNIVTFFFPTSIFSMSVVPPSKPAFLSYCRWVRRTAQQWPSSHLQRSSLFGLSSTRSPPSSQSRSSGLAGLPTAHCAPQADGPPAPLELCWCAPWPHNQPSYIQRALSPSPSATRIPHGRTDLGPCLRAVATFRKPGCAAVDSRIDSLAGCIPVCASESHY